MHKKYLGDGVYANFDGYHITLTTENGYGTSNRIYLDPSVFRELHEYGLFVQRIRERAIQPAEQTNQPQDKEESC